MTASTRHPDPFLDGPTTLRVERHGAVARVTLDRPDVRNAFNNTMMKEVRDATAKVLDETTFADLMEQQDRLSRTFAALDFTI